MQMIELCEHLVEPDCFCPLWQACLKKRLKRSPRLELSPKRAKNPLSVINKNSIMFRSLSKNDCLYTLSLYKLLALINLNLNLVIWSAISVNRFSFNPILNFFSD